MYIIIGVTAFVASALTLFSGFGLGTILLPAFSLFFPVTVAVALAAVVHLLNNLFKAALLGKHADWPTVLRFGIPAIIAALLGAMLLIALSGLPPLLTYELLSSEHAITPVKLSIALLMIFFAVIEFLPRFADMKFDPKYLPLGGMISGFFGGLSGHQGAFRSAFLIKTGLTKEAFIGTGVILAIMVDISRLAVYGTQLSLAFSSQSTAALLVATLAAFLGAFIGSRLIKKVTMRSIQIVVSVMLLLIAVALGGGLI